MKAACDAFDAVPADMLLGWCAVVLVAFAITAHFATWGRE